MHQFFQTLSIDDYFCDLMIATCITALIVSIRKRRKYPFLKYFPLYLTSSLAQSILCQFYAYGNENISLEMVYASTNVFICVEYFVIANFYFQLRLSTRIQKGILVMSIAFYVLALLIWIMKKNFFDHPNEIFVLEAIFTIPIALTYFYILFKYPPVKILSQDFAFWVSTGVLFFFTITLPFFLIQEKLEIDVAQLLYSINYLAYAILFSLIIKAYLCKTETSNYYS